VTVTVVDGGASSDSITVASSTCTFHFGAISLGSTAYATGSNLTFKGSGSNVSTIAWDPVAQTLTILLGGKSGGTQGTVSSSVATYTPDAAITNVVSTAITGTFATGNVAQF
jgi:hypothetical protein